MSLYCEEMKAAAKVSASPSSTPPSMAPGMLPMPPSTDTIACVRRQTDVSVDLQVDEHEGAPLHPDQQLQVLFILQEALSNVRKHAHAGRVSVRIDNQRDLCVYRALFENLF